MKMSEKNAQWLGRIGSILSVLMYVSYIPQVMDNLQGNKGNPIQPLVAFINCLVWTGYGLFKKEKDWPIVIANVPGIFCAFISFLTAII